MNVIRWILATPFYIVGGALCLVLVLPCIAAWMIFNTGQLIANKENVSADASVKITRGG